MNKDVIYIEPEDDITDIITKIESSKEKIVAIVPPKKANVFHSIVNIKLMAKAGVSAEKTIVLVTTDPAILRLAGAARIPATKDLQTAPTIPQVDTEVKDDVAKEDLVEKKDGEAEGAPEKAEEAPEEEKKPEKKEKKDKKPLVNPNTPFGAWIQAHKKPLIGCGVGLFVIIVIMIWAFGIAPAVEIIVKLRTVTNNFSENATFTTNLAEEDASAGKFFLDEKSFKEEFETEFEATGTKNIGDKATGEIILYTDFREIGSVTMPAGTIFTNNGLSYASDSQATVAWDGEGSSCYGGKPTATGGNFYCRVYSSVDVTAIEPGAKYNIDASTDWIITGYSIKAYSNDPMVGGSDKTIIVVQQSDIDKALSQYTATNEAINKEKLYQSLGEDAFKIEDSFKQTVGTPVVTPALGEEVETGKKVKLKVTTTATVFVIDDTKVKEFISEKAKLAENYKIYEMNNPFIENFIKTEAGYTGKIKTSYVSGPSVTENDIVNAARGKGLGTAMHDIKSINGIADGTRLNPSYPWVNSVPDDPERITVVIKTDDEN